MNAQYNAAGRFDAIHPATTAMRLPRPAVFFVCLLVGNLLLVPYSYAGPLLQIDWQNVANQGDVPANGFAAYVSYGTSNFLGWQANTISGWSNVTVNFTLGGVPSSTTMWVPLTGERLGGGASVPLGTNNFKMPLDPAVPPSNHILLGTLCYGPSQINKLASGFLANAVLQNTKWGRVYSSINKQGTDFTLNITNDGDTSITLDTIVVRVGDTQDPFDLSQPFVPDGDAIDVQTSVIVSPGISLTLNEPDPTGYSVISVETVYTDAGGNTFYDVVATAIPEPTTLSLLGAGFIYFFVMRKSRS